MNKRTEEIFNMKQPNKLELEPNHELVGSADSLCVVRRYSKQVIDAHEVCEGDETYNYTDIFMLSESNEPVQDSVDVATGHLILSYMEEHLRDPSRSTTDWESIENYEPEEAVPCEEAKLPCNLNKNRKTAPYPYELSRVKLRAGQTNYINASLVYDDTPRNPVYIATITPTNASIADFWLMIWEQSCVVIVCLENMNEMKSFRDSGDLPDLADDPVIYWPSEGTQKFGLFEIHLVSEHSWCENYLIRSFYLKNINTNETRTITQFHYLTWNDRRLKQNSRQILEFRRKVNRSFRSLMSPILVHCNDGCGRTGTYIVLDLVLNRIVKGVKEIDLVASVEHLRDQRPKMVQTMEQYEFVLTAIAQEVDAMLKTGT